MKLATGALIGLAVVFLVTMWLTASPGHRIDFETFAEVHGYMTEAELSDLFGRPPGRYNAWPLSRDISRAMTIHHLGFRDSDSTDKTLNWVSDEANITVYFNSAGKITVAEAVSCETMPSAVCGMIAGWFGF
jgi:hypothetical protein